MDKYFWKSFGKYAMPILTPAILAILCINFDWMIYVMATLIGAMILAVVGFTGLLVVEEAQKMREADK